MTMINLKTKLSTITVGTTAFVLGTAAISQAAMITPGFTFSVSDDYIGPSFVGTHFHSSTGGDFGNPAGLAEVGGFFDIEEVRGLSEYDISGLTDGGPAFVTFEVFYTDGLFGQGGGSFDIDVLAYVGNNTEDLSDYQEASIGFLGQFNTSGLDIGDTVSFDVARLLDGLITNGDDSLGIRLQQTVRNTSGPAYTFNNFRLTTTDESTNGTTVPEPASILGLLAIGGLGTTSLRRKKSI